MYKRQLLTHAFDAAMLWREGKPLRALWQAYDVRTGNLWALVTAACLLAPVWAASA